jgi:hypothetical protein
MKRSFTLRSVNVDGELADGLEVVGEAGGEVLGRLRLQRGLGAVTVRAVSLMIQTPARFT